MNRNFFQTRTIDVTFQIYIYRSACQPASCVILESKCRTCVMGEIILGQQRAYVWLEYASSMQSFVGMCYSCVFWVSIPFQEIPRVFCDCCRFFYDVIVIFHIPCYIQFCTIFFCFIYGSSSRLFWWCQCWPGFCCMTSLLTWLLLHDDIIVDLIIVAWWHHCWSGYIYIVAWQSYKMYCKFNLYNFWSNLIFVSLFLQYC